LKLQYHIFLGDIVEKMLKNQWFLKTSGVSQKALEAASNGSLKLHPENNHKLWSQWLSSNRFLQNLFLIIGLEVQDFIQIL